MPLKRWLGKLFGPRKDAAALEDEATKQKRLAVDLREQIQRHVRPLFPNRIALSLAEAPCVLRCRMCPQFQEERRRLFPESRFMSWEVFNAISAGFPDGPDMQLEISAYCDPLQHPDCEAMIRSFRDSHPQTYIILATEGVLLDERRTSALLESGVTHVSFSLNAASREAYQWLCGRDLYDKAKSNLLRLIERRQAMTGDKPIITTHIIGVKENEKDFEAFTSFWRQHLPDGVAIRTYGNWGGLVDGQVTPLDGWREVDWAGRYPCLNPFNAIKIVSNGDYFACFLDIYSGQASLGNVLRTGIEEVWRTAYQRHRERHLAGDFEVRLCGRCMVWSLFPNVFVREPGGGYHLNTGGTP